MAKKNMKVGLAGSKLWNQPRPVQNSLVGLKGCTLMVMEDVQGAGKFLKDYSLRQYKNGRKAGMQKPLFVRPDPGEEKLDAIRSVYATLVKENDFVIIFRNIHSKLELELIELCKREGRPYILYEA